MFEIVVIVPASMVLVCAIARHWYVLEQLRKDIERDREKIRGDLDRFRGL